MKNRKHLKELTKAELQIMQMLWEKGNVFVNELVEQFPDPKPAYNTVSTIVRILERKGFVSHEVFGKSHRYFSTVSRESYLNSYMGNMLSSFFSGSVSNLVSFMSKKEKISVKEADEILKIINNIKK
ncbi:MAG: BlaI/MecI/CopY family transcriptional regulator [Bacteroidales bacterium]|nr:BlaI/MecI/CopY family transcriptional regulator [Bacteroidales bacterium]MDD2425034.1 BlaI/MecI/CopY family transcriptional regulator [Bacteroidales bacterium]MDD3989325.1 BlaI/MecI/CopY family transcriptional regulator [Bacteroidales bacterium]MDD4638666.1 BlaI/MecI/CopY family transcriptional regulator [Bacteroidales bacterium]